MLIKSDTTEPEQIFALSLNAKSIWNVIYGAPIAFLLLSAGYVLGTGTFWSSEKLGLASGMFFCLSVWLLVIYRIIFRRVLLTLTNDGLSETGLIFPAGLLPWHLVRDVGSVIFDVPPFSPITYTFVDLIDERSFLAGRSLFERLWRMGNRAGTGHLILLPNSLYGVSGDQLVEACRARIRANRLPRLTSE